MDHEILEYMVYPIFKKLATNLWSLLLALWLYGWMLSIWKYTASITSLNYINNTYCAPLYQQLQQKTILASSQRLHHHTIYIFKRPDNCLLITLFRSWAYATHCRWRLKILKHNYIILTCNWNPQLIISWAYITSTKASITQFMTM